MNSRVRVALPERERRTHAERTAETRSRVIGAVIESIAEVGYQRTTAAEIARRAGVTWGAVQHHFGDKDGILTAVLEDAFERFSELLDDVPAADVTLEQRVALFVDRSWQHFGSPHYRSTFEILLNLSPNLELSWRDEMREAWRRIWSRYFPSSRPSRRETVDLLHYAHSVLFGLAARQVLEGQRSAIRSRELDFLKDTLQRELARGEEMR